MNYKEMYCYTILFLQKGNIPISEDTGHLCSTSICPWLVNFTDYEGMYKNRVENDRNSSWKQRNLAENGALKFKMKYL